MGLIIPGIGSIVGFGSAAGSGVGPTFALLTMASDANGQNFTTAAAIPFDTVVYDYGGWVSGSTFVIPSGVTKVRMGGQIGLANHNGSLRYLEIRKSGASLTYPVKGNFEDAGNVQIADVITSYLLDVSAGEVYSLYFYSGTDTSCDIIAAATWFSIERFL
jgi:hypothetical protein